MSVGLATTATLMFPSSVRSITVLPPSLSLRRGQGQIDSVELILKRVGALPAGSAVIVLGDFNNVAEHSELSQIATGHGLRDAWLVADERRGPALTLSDFGPPDDGRIERVDWILVGGPIGVRWVETVLHRPCSGGGTGGQD